MIKQISYKILVFFILNFYFLSKLSHLLLKKTVTYTEEVLVYLLLNFIHYFPKQTFDMSNFRLVICFLSAPEIQGVF